MVTTSWFCGLGCFCARSAFILCIVLLSTQARGTLGPAHLLRTFVLQSGRSTACPRSITYEAVSPGLVIRAEDTSVDGSECTGPAGKVLRSRDTLFTAGLSLPQLCTRSTVKFMGAVESAPKVCGKWAFNASTVSWYLTSDVKFSDSATGIRITPGILYAIYTHFADLCVYTSKLNLHEIAEINSSAERASVANKGRHSCFPEDATVRLEDGSRKRMSELKVRDRVLVSGGRKPKYSDVYVFSHEDRDAVAEFVRLRTSTGQSLSMTPGHLIYANGKLITAYNTRVGDIVQLSSGKFTTVNSVEFVMKRGLYNPQTLHGDIVVDDVVVSTWTIAVTPRAAHALLTPLRTFHAMGRQTELWSRFWQCMFNVFRNVPTMLSPIFQKHT